VAKITKLLKNRSTDQVVAKKNAQHCNAIRIAIGRVKICEDMQTVARFRKCKLRNGTVCRKICDMQIFAKYAMHA